MTDKSISWTIRSATSFSTSLIVTHLLSREEFSALQSEEFVEEAFDGSLPKFLTAFTFRKKLSSEEIDQLQQLIDKSRR